MQLTKSEMELMNAFWDAERPICKNEILDVNHSYRESSIYILLNGLLRKGAIVETGMVKRVKTYSRTFAPAMSRETYWAQLAYSGTREQQPVTPTLIAEILFEAQICPDAVPAILAEARDEFDRRAQK